MDFSTTSPSVALDQAVKTQLQIPIARSATFDLEVTKGRPTGSGLLISGGVSPFRDVFGTDTARINVDLCGQSNNNPIVDEPQDALRYLTHIVGAYLD